MFKPLVRYGTAQIMSVYSTKADIARLAAEQAMYTRSTGSF